MTLDTEGSKARLAAIKAQTRRTKRLDIAVFDFDGTLRDSLLKITFLYDMAGRIICDRLNRPHRHFTVENMRDNTGLPVKSVGQQFYGKAGEDIAEDFGKAWDAVAAFARTGALPAGNISISQDHQKAITAEMPEAKWFPSVPLMLADLYRDHVYLAVLSNPPSIEALRNEVRQERAGAFFDDIYTGGPLGQGKPDARALMHVVAKAYAKLEHPKLAQGLEDAALKGQVDTHDRRLNSIMKKWSQSDLDLKVVMVGDGWADIEAANNARASLDGLKIPGKQGTEISTIGLTYGFQTAEQIAPKGPTTMVSRERDLQKAIYAWRFGKLGHG